MSNITQVVRNEKDLTILDKGLTASGLDKTLSGEGSFTLFAPSDKAFGKMDSQSMETLLKPENKMGLTELLNHHVVAGKYHFKDFNDGDKLTSLNGKELSVGLKDGKITIDGAVIQNRDVLASNGAVHSLDAVIKK